MARELTYVQAITEALEQSMERDERVILLGEDIGEFGGAFGATRGLWKRFGAERVRDTAISEAAIIGSATGAAMTGMRPVAELQYSDFVTVGMDQLVNQAAKIRYMFGGTIGVPMVLRAPTGGYLSEAAQHSQNLEAWFAHTPGLKVMLPSTPRDAKGMLIAAIESNDPVVFLEHKVLYKSKGDVPEEPFSIAIGSADIKRTGEDIVVITYSYTTQLCLNAAEKLAEQGIDACVIDLRTVSPIDFELIQKEVARIGRAIVVHEAPEECGIGAEVVSRITNDCFADLRAPVLRVAGRNVPTPYSPVLQKQVLPQVDDIVAAVARTVEYRYGRR